MSDTIHKRSRDRSSDLATRGVLDRGYGSAGLLGIVLFAFHALVGLFGGEEAFRDLWMAAWFVYLFIGVGLLLAAMTVHAAICAGRHWPLDVVAAIAPLYALYALANLGLPVPGSQWLMLQYAPGLAVSLLYAGLCVGVSVHWFVLGRKTD
jgi:hypothetical membrane protein